MHRGEAPPAPSGQADTNRIDAARVLRWIALILAIPGAVLVTRDDPLIATIFYRTQDAPVIGLLCVLLVAISFRFPRLRIQWREPRTAWIWAGALALVLIAWAGTHWVLSDYRLARDTRMVEFDMGIFASGRLAQTLPEFWRPFAEALVPNFLLDVPQHALVVSNYLPGNALLRAAFDAIGAASLMNPLLVGIGFVALWDIVRRELADRPGAAWVALATYALSVQVLATGMTAYSMTGLLAINLIWLALFLRDKPWLHAAAIVLGFAGIGYHQVVFHPLFVAPFLLTLLPARRWWLFLTYGAVYGAATLFWFAYPSLIVASAGVVATEGSAAGVQNFVTDRIAPLFVHRVQGSLLSMELNALRFAAWMPFFMLPFAALAWPAIRHNRGLALPAFGGIMLLLTAMFVLLPAQGHGWGYRYLHGFIGNVAILAGWGYHWWASSRREEADGTFALLAAATVLLATPFLLWSAHRFIEPYVRLSHLLERQAAVFVVVDTDSGRTAVDQIANRADLANRPLLLASNFLSVKQIGQLCDRGRIAFVGPVAFGDIELEPPRGPQPNPRFAKLSAAADARGCRVPVR